MSPGSLRSKAVAIQEKACDGGDATGCFNLGIMYANCRGVTKDEAKAVQLYQKACDGGYAAGCNNVRALSVIACKAGDAQWCLDGGRWVQNMLQRKRQNRAPEGVKLNEGWPSFFGEASKLFQQACDGGDLKGCVTLAELYDKGEGVEANGAKAAQRVLKKV